MSAKASTFHVCNKRRGNKNTGGAEGRLSAIVPAFFMVLIILIVIYCALGTWQASLDDYADRDKAKRT